MEGLAYLTLDADVKDDFVQDIPALQAMFELAKASVALTSHFRKGFLEPGPQGLNGCVLILALSPPLCQPRLAFSFFLALILTGCSRLVTPPAFLAEGG